MSVRNGSEYTAGLKDGRDVWLDGERVTDVSTHASLALPAASIARLYDRQLDPAESDELTFKVGGDDVAAMSYLIPESVEDVARRGRAFKSSADETGGLMGRSPDFVNSVITSWAAGSEFFAAGDSRFGQNVIDYYEHCRDNDVCLTHAITDPQTDRSRAAHEQDDPYTVLGLVKETSEGIIVRGAKMIATLAPLADEVLIYGFSKLGPADSAYALAFALPVDTPGVRILCRRSFATRNDHEMLPLSAGFDEMDAMVIFHDVLVPWEKVFIKGDVDIHNGLRTQTDMIPFCTQQAATRGWAKAQFAFGVATMMTEAIGTQGAPPVQEKLGEMLNYVEMMRAFVRAAEADAAPGRFGCYLPNRESLIAAAVTFPRSYPRILELLQQLGSSGLLMTPVVDADGETAEDIAKYMSGAGWKAADRVRVFRVASELAINTFGGRQELYERFYAGDLSRLLAGSFMSYDKEPARSQVQHVMDGLDQRAALPVG